MGGAGRKGPLSIQPVNLPEVIAAILGIANITLLVRRSIWNYPFGLAMVALFGVIFFSERLYSEALLQPFFFVTQLYGWWAWWHAGGVQRPVPVVRMTPAARVAWVFVIALLTLGWGSLMRVSTNGAFPWWDGGIAIMSIAAQILLARRRIENWILWILVDLISIPLYVIKQLPLTALLYSVFLLLSVLGLREWLRAERETSRS